MILYSLQEVFGFFSYFTIPLLGAVSEKRYTTSHPFSLLAPKLLAPFCSRWKPNTSSSAEGVWPVKSLEKLSVHLSEQQTDGWESAFPPQPSPTICLPCYPHVSVPLKITRRSLASSEKTTAPSQLKSELAHMVEVKLRSSSQKCFVKFFCRQVFSSKIVSPRLLFCLVSLSFIFLVELKCRHSLLADVVWDSYILLCLYFSAFITASLSARWIKGLSIVQSMQAIHDGLFYLAIFSSMWFIVCRWFIVRKLLLNPASACGWLKFRSPCSLFTSAFLSTQIFVCSKEQ